MKPDYNVALTLMRQGNSDMIRRLKPDASDLIDEIERLVVENERLEDENEDLSWRLGD